MNDNFFDQWARELRENGASARSSDHITTRLSFQEFFAAQGAQHLQELALSHGVAARLSSDKSSFLRNIVKAELSGPADSVFKMLLQARHDLEAYELSEEREQRQKRTGNPDPSPFYHWQRAFLHNGNDPLGLQPARFKGNTEARNWPSMASDVAEAIASSGCALVSLDQRGPAKRNAPTELSLEITGSERQLHAFFGLAAARYEQRMQERTLGARINRIGESFKQLVASAATTLLGNKPDEPTPARRPKP